MAEHGTNTRYKYGCRCDPCREASMLKQREYRETMKAKHGCIPSQVNRKRRPRKGMVCAKCGKAIQSNAGNASDGQILCKPHRDAERKLQRRYAARQMRIAKALMGTFSSGKSTWIAATCHVCTKPFLTAHSMAMCCSATCTERNRMDKRQALRQRRRARKREAFVSNVSPRKVFEADGYRCHLCRRKTLPDKQVPHPRAPTVDHIVPLAAGGTHEPLNCRTACFQCNALKRDRCIGKQLLLIA